MTLDLRLSGFIQEDSDEQVDLQASGFLPWTHTHSDHHPPRARTSREEPQQSSVGGINISSVCVPLRLVKMLTNAELTKTDKIKLLPMGQQQPRGAIE